MLKEIPYLNCVSLEILKVANNLIQSLNGNVLKKLISLKSLHLQRNKLMVK